MIRMAYPYEIKELKTLLGMEGLKGKEMMFDSTFTWVLVDSGEIKGFFSIRRKPTSGFYVLSHFLVKRECRSNLRARELVKAVMLKMKNLKAKQFIIDSLCSEKLDKIIQYYFKVKPYSTNKGYSYYLVGVR